MGNRLTSPIPNDTREALALHNWRIDNIALLLNKYLDFLKIESIDFTKEASNCDLEKFTIIKINGIYYRINSINKNSQIKNISFFPVVRYRQIPEKIERGIIKKVIKELNLDKDYENRFIEKLLEYRKHLINLISFGEIGNLLNRIICRQTIISDESFTLTTQSRLVVGLGSGSVLETSIKLHHIYGIPYIPASAIKGVLRAYKIWKTAKENEYNLVPLNWLIENYKEGNFNNLKEKVIEKINKGDFNNIFVEIYKNLELIIEPESKEKKEDLQKEIKRKIEQLKREKIIPFIKGLQETEIKNIIKIFGNQHQKSKLIFLDAYPESFEGFDIDIMNPHYPEYYNGDEPPADWQNPRPITFLALPEGTRFLFFFKNLEAYDSNILEDLREAFLNIGIGGKTSLGYGILE